VFTSVSSGCWGEDSSYELAGAAHFHVASPVLFLNTSKILYLQIIMKTVSVNLNENSHVYEIAIQNGSLTDSGTWVKSALHCDTSKIAIISNAKVFALYGEHLKESLLESGFDVFVWLMEDGEEFKNLASLESAFQFLSQSRITRTGAIIALGGGVVGDLAGFAASIFLRGISFLQIPTTLLAMIDSSVGGKTAVNTEFGKNLIGTFYQPKGVLIDVSTLATLEIRELTAGFCEAIKQGAISNRELFDQTAEFLTENSLPLLSDQFSDQNFVTKFEKLLAAQIAFKAEIVMQDEREAADRMDAKSRKILNFGHTFAHALEKVTDYKYFKHGEAVGYGILFAGELSKTLELFDRNRLNLLYDVIHRAGELPALDKINKNDIYDAFAFDKKVINDSLHWVLLEDFGKPFIRANAEIPKSAIQNVLDMFLTD
jgi:3-dehydroquinate synthase